ncbi:MULTISPECIES: hypothetical protein [Planktothrix]|uniref:hypothetical protein n=1 Tax=Planktothrix TaxID=54304 RepID=UPI0016449187|nr:MULTISPECIES: hypothetical protein [Planktothrix]
MELDAYSGSNNSDRNGIYCDISFPVFSKKSRNSTEFYNTNATAVAIATDPREHQGS